MKTEIRDKVLKYTLQGFGVSLIAAGGAGVLPTYESQILSLIGGLLFMTGFSLDKLSDKGHSD